MKKNEAVAKYNDNLKKIINEKASHSFKAFVAVTYPEYTFNWHHNFLIKKLDAFAKGKIKKLMVFMPPQHGKSELVSRRLPSFIFGLKPNLSVVGCSYSIDLARKFNRAIQRIMIDKTYRDVFPHTKLNDKRTVTTGSYLLNSEEFEIVDHKGFYKAVGVMGGLTGNKVDIGIIDDPVKDRVEANSQTYRNRVWDWYTDVFLTRLHNDSQVLFTMTRWHEDDLAGRILEKEKDWELITFPAIREDMSNKNDPRAIGDALWPDRHGIDKLLNVKSNSQSTWSSLYQQRPAPEDGNIIKKDWFNFFDQDKHMVNPSSLEMYIDSAYTDNKKNDPTAIMIREVRAGRIYIHSCTEHWLEFPELINKIEDLSIRYFGRSRAVIRIEGKASGKVIVQYLKSKTNHIVNEDKEIYTSKVERMIAVSPIIEAGNVYLPNEAPWLSKFLEQVTKFPNAKHDDMADCLSAVCRTSLRPGIRAAYRQ